ncbi:hypothetical protein, partial [Pseudovibrio sp. WM33]|uniref:hypothetical protein n=1 Tax=Pseudovibrio sp. WM33 TaxID=1735585 RepID=UPI0019D339B1
FVGYHAATIANVPAVKPAFTDVFVKDGGTVWAWKRVWVSHCLSGKLAIVPYRQRGDVVHYKKARARRAATAEETYLNK